MASVEVQSLSKYYQVHHKQPGLRGSLGTLFNRRYDTIKAVEDVSFSIQPGEIVGFLGPNGAGKTTTLKCLSGLLYPTRGQVTVLGYTPFGRSRAFLKSITLVMGQRNQLLWDLPAMETFLVNQAIYNIPAEQFRVTLDELVSMLQLENLLDKQVRKLSLGERMRCELAASLLHQPEVLFLDEPTLGLDLNAQVAIRDFILNYNQRSGATVLLTSHYMADVTALARRILVIEHGNLVYDGDLRALVEKHTLHKFLQLTFEQSPERAQFAFLGGVPAREVRRSEDGLKITLQVDRAAIKQAAAYALSSLPVTDVTIEDPPIEDIIRLVFRQGEQIHAPAAGPRSEKHAGTA